MLALNILSNLTDIIFKDRSNIDIDDYFFKMFYRITSTIYFICVVIIIGNSFAVDPIKCLGDSYSGMSEDLINTHCWTISTFSYKKTKLEIDSMKLNENSLLHFLGESNDMVSHSYYQWIPVLFTFSTVLFYLPHLIWKKLEGGVLKYMLSNCKLHILDENKEDLTKLANHLITNKKNFFLYGYKYTFCKLCNYFCIFINIYFTDLFFNNLLLDNRFDILYNAEILFPLQSKCIFKSYGYSGSEQLKDFLCILPINLLNKKIMIILYILNIFLIIFSILDIIYFLIAVLSKLFFKHFNFDFIILIYLIEINLPKNKFNELMDLLIV